MTDFDRVWKKIAASITAPTNLWTDSDFYRWAKTAPSKHGFSYLQRFDYWAGFTNTSSKGKVLFMFIDEDVDPAPCIPTTRDGNRATVVSLVDMKSYVVSIYNLMPVFPNSLTTDGMLRAYNELVHLINTTKEPISKSAEEVDYFAQNIAKVSKPEQPPTGSQIKQTTEETEEMKKSVATNMINVNKDALKEVGYLNAGRASNKVIKEACRPLLNLMFKPTFMQKLGMKIFKMENPVDVALKSAVSDVFCAQLVQLIIELRGVENENVREVAKAGIVYSGLQLSQSIPLEEAIDKVVEVLEKEAGEIVSKMQGKK
ncbi:hypothetical protein [Vibrio phage JSF12]|uniref:Uncharacterized protein n=2 Tax=Jesfedecavirus TaxID=2560156 RepID=A0A2D0Z6H8_9CAUD|nr:hypothetical protein FDI98_gp017 [Vibrio phage JSF10]YP_009794748.1 hypothetical protein HOS35_gp065 [Vibrio phage JSF12]ASV43515.1 hypothetical protein [Vibrio phage JSF10]ASV43583.1 hypothetical protein [Vibrio phage JSF12]